MNIDQLKYCTEQYIAPKRKASCFIPQVKSEAVQGIYYPPLGQFVYNNAIEWQKAQETYQQSTNPDYPQLTHIITTLVDWKQVQKYCLHSAETQVPLSNTNSAIRLPPEVFQFDADALAPQDEFDRKPRPLKRMKQLKIMDTPDTVDLTSRPISIIANKKHNGDDRLRSTTSNGTVSRIVASATEYTLRFLFFHVSAGIYVKIERGRLAMFVPFVNSNYTNLWHQEIQLHKRAGVLPSLSLSKWQFRDRLYSDDFDGQFISDEGFAQYQHLLLAVCEQYIQNSTGEDSEQTNTINSLCVEFCINLCGFPVLRSDNLDPIMTMLFQTSTPTSTSDEMYKQRFKLKRESEISKRHVPIYSNFGGDSDSLDLLIPTFRDWELANPRHYFLTSRNDYQSFLIDLPKHSLNIHYEEWSRNRTSTVYFRSRLHLEDVQTWKLTILSRQWATNSSYNGENLVDQKPFLDAAWFQLVHPYGILPRNIHSQIERELSILGSRQDQQYNLPVITNWNSTIDLPFLMHQSHFDDSIDSLEQFWTRLFTYKYCLYVSDRETRLHYGLLMLSGCVIFKVDSDPGKQTWMSHCLIPYVDHIPVAHDLSDLAQQIHWAKTHPHQCFQIAQAAQELYYQRFNRQGIINYWLHQLVASSRT